VRLSGEVEAVFIALVRPHLPPLSFCTILLGGDGANCIFEVHRSAVMAPPSSCCRASGTGCCSSFLLLG
jgi:hypothetical protein